MWGFCGGVFAEGETQGEGIEEVARGAEDAGVDVVRKRDGVEKDDAVITGFEDATGLTKVGCEAVFDALTDAIADAEVVVAGEGLDGFAPWVAGEDVCKADILVPPEVVLVELPVRLCMWVFSDGDGVFGVDMVFLGVEGGRSVGPLTTAVEEVAEEEGCGGEELVLNGVVGAPHELVRVVDSCFQGEATAGVGVGIDDLGVSDEGHTVGSCT